MERIVRYHDNMKEFIESNKGKIAKLYSNFHITLICDGVKLQGSQNTAYQHYLGDGKLTHITWRTFLLRTRQVHQDFLDNAERQKRMVTHQDAVEGAKDA